MPTLAVLAIIVVAVVIGLIAMKLEGLTLFAPRRTKQLRGTAQTFCLDHCRTPEDECPLGVDMEDCPLWQFVDEDLPNDSRVDPTRPALI